MSSLPAVQEPRIELPRKELLSLAAVNPVFYCREFFPKTFRQVSPEFHKDFWGKFEDANYDFFAAEMFRGSGKTTLTRAGISRRIAYGVSRNILAVAISEAMAIHTIRWLKRAIETNLHWTETFLLRKGQKWTDDWIEIVNVPFDCTINVIAKGMTSGLRGLNPDDWRPDFIFCDDISNEETVGTEEQRIKNSELFFGALVPCLAPKSEAPMRKLVLAQTALHKDDIVNKTHADPTFKTVKYAKLVENERGEQESAWPARFPTPEVVKEKEDYARRNQAHVWLREYGCKIISRETAPLDGAWLRYWTALPTDLIYFLGIDPATDSKKKKAHKAAIATIGVQPRTGDTYLCSYFAERGKNPDELWTEYLGMHRQYHPRKAGTETVAFQKMLAWYFRKKMQEDRVFFTITEVNDKRPKPQRIIDAFGMASHGKFYVSPNHAEFIQGWTEWDGESDWDLGDATAQAIALANPWMMSAEATDDVIDADYVESERDIPDLVFEGGAP